jgi:hypothetical protein
VSALDSSIDDLYRAPLGTFVDARNALAKTLKGADAKRIRALAKPTLVPWAVNQVYWRARGVYDRLIKSGQRLRDAQVAALEGRKVDVRAASDAHRQAIADAVKEASTIAATEGSQPPSDALMRMFEALSLAPERADAPGRWTKPLQPAGFEALSGINVARSKIEVAVESPKPETHKQSAAERRREEAETKRAEAERKQAEAARKKREAEIKKAEAAVERARRRMADAESALKQLRGQ